MRVITLPQLHENTENMLQNKYCTAQYKLGPLSHKFINTKIFQHFPLIFKTFKTQLLKNFKPFKQNHGPCTFTSMKSHRIGIAYFEIFLM